MDLRMGGVAFNPHNEFVKPLLKAKGATKDTPRYEYTVGDFIGFCIGDDALLRVLRQHEGEAVRVKRVPS